MAWFEKWFESPYYLSLYPHRNHNEANDAVDWICRVYEHHRTTPALSAHVLDVAAGAARHAIAFALRGWTVTANDLSSTLLELGKREAELRGVHLRFTQYDMRYLPFENEFDLATQLFTSFGYFDTKEEDVMVVRGVRKSLKEGGMYVLDFLNANALCSGIVPFSKKENDDVVAEERRWIEHDLVKKHITIHLKHAKTPQSPLEFEERVRLYDDQQLSDILETNGFHIEQIVGNYDGCTFDRTRSPRCILIATAV